MTDLKLRIIPVMDEVKKAFGEFQKTVSKGIGTSAQAGAGGKGTLGFLGKIALPLMALDFIKKGIGKMVSILSEASPTFKGILGIFKRAMLIFFKPFGDFLGSLLKPMAILMIRMATGFLKWTQAFGESVGKLMAGDLIGFLGDVWEGTLDIGAWLLGVLGQIAIAPAQITAAFYSWFLKVFENITGIDTGFITDILDKFISDPFGTIAKGLTSMWENILLPAWNILSEGLIWVWEELLKPIFDAFAEGMNWWWTNITEPILNIIGEGLRFAWENVLKPVWGIISDGLQWIWDNALEPIWTTISIGLKTAWDAIEPIWDGIRNSLQAFWNWLKSTPIGTFLGLQTGGEISKTGPYILHEGETVIPSNRHFSSNFSPTYNIYNSGGSFDADDLMRRANRNAERDLRRRLTFL